MSKWNSGPPPSLGWWPASAFKTEGLYRWWNGQRWSIAAEYGDSIKQVRDAAASTTGLTGIFWQARPKSWPAGSFT